MEFQQILGFYHVARLRSFTNAAAATARTQSALSQQVKALEEEFGCRLLERAGRAGVFLTAEGEAVYQFCSNVLAGRRALEEEIDALQGLRRGRVRIAAPFTTLWQLLPVRLREFSQRFPGVDVAVLDRPQAEVLSLLQAGEIDLGIAVETPVGSAVRVLRWKKLRTVLLVADGHPLAGRSEVGLEQVVAYPLILPPVVPGRRSPSAVVRLLEELELPVRVAVESSNVELTARFVSEGIGLAFATTVADESVRLPENVRLIPLAHPFPRQHLALFVRTARAEAPAVRALIEVLLGGRADASETSVAPRPTE